MMNQGILNTATTLPWPLMIKQKKFLKNFRFRKDIREIRVSAQSLMTRTPRENFEGEHFLLQKLTFACPPCKRLRGHANFSNILQSYKFEKLFQPVYKGPSQSILSNKQWSTFIYLLQALTNATWCMVQSAVAGLIHSLAWIPTVHTRIYNIQTVEEG